MGKMDATAAKEKIAKALDIRDKVAEHQDTDQFTHHVHAPMVEAVNELTTAAIDAQFGSPKPRYEALAKSLAAKEAMAKNGLFVSAEEELWHEELEDGIKAVVQ